MTKEELKIELSKIGVIESDYSIDEGLKSDAYIIEEYDGLWRFFYYDEKGEESQQSLFKSKEESFKYLVSTFKDQLKLLGKDNFR
ncbi:hypothetical protein [Aquimarina celericrescens]|uniref:Uncharacterized protein n=1 Tax=Aquimarina celericrescens TaxID=1964542 RepID=A0ABW5B0U6_9FLAO|nr:hypothetical protein [Aquimarina celericrescens]